VASCVSLGLGLILGYRPEGGFVGVVLGLALLLLFAFSVGWIFTALGMVLRTPQAVLSVSMMVLFPLTFTTNIFVDPETMPSWMQSIVEANPISHLTTGVRGLMGGDAHSGDIMYVLVASAILLVIFAPLTVKLFYRER
jgi:ABC-2 type transport system permease protein